MNSKLYLLQAEHKRSGLTIILVTRVDSLFTDVYLLDPKVRPCKSSTKDYASLLEEYKVVDKLVDEDAEPLVERMERELEKAGYLSYPMFVSLLNAYGEDIKPSENVLS